MDDVFEQFFVSILGKNIMISMATKYIIAILHYYGLLLLLLLLL